MKKERTPFDAEKEKRLFDARQRDLFQQAKPVDAEWFQEWLNKQIDEATPQADAAFFLRLRHALQGKTTSRMIHESLNEELLRHMRNSIVHGLYVSNKPAPSSAVPYAAEIALLFMLPKKARETLPEDLAEEFRDVIVPKMGLRLARIWYWSQVVRAVPWVWLIAAYEVLKAKIGL